MTDIREIDPATTRVSPLNPRKTLGDITALVESVRDHGVIEPAIARERSGLELIIGQRRRAAAIAAERMLPVIVRDLTDDEALDLALAENIERNDLEPLEEAQAYADRLERGQTIEHVADRISRAPGYVARRLKLLELGKEARAALARDEITVGVAEMIGRVPAKLQKQALESVVATKYERAPSNAEAGRALRDSFMLRLATASFDRADATLVPRAGPCTTCPHRTGNQAELFSDVDSPDLCTVPDCFTAKTRAGGTRAVAAAKKESKTVLSVAEAKKLFTVHGELSYAAKYKDLDGEVYAGAGSTKRTKVRKLVGDKVETVFALDPHTGKLHELVVKTVVDAAVRKLTKTPASPRDKTTAKREKAARAKQKLGAEAREQIRARVVANVAAAKPTPVDALLVCLPHVDFSSAAVLTRHGIECPKKFAGYNWEPRALRAFIDKHKSDVGGLFAELVVNQLEEECYRPEQEKELNAVCSALGVDRANIKRAVLAELADKAKEQAVKPKAAKAQKKKPARGAQAKRVTKRLRPTLLSQEAAKAAGTIATNEDGEVICRGCGCSEFDPCPAGCAWVEADLCSSCAGAQPKGKKKTAAPKRAR